jgi:hypothetical protein
VGWLPPPGPESGLRTDRPWTPPGLGDATTDGLTYVVVDEILGASVGLTVSPWPTLDEKGRLRFFEGEPKTLGADRAALERFLSEHRLPREHGDRPLRVGDVFAVRTIEPALAAVEQELADTRRLEPFLAPEEWILPPVYDVTADAREAAKASFYAAVAPVLAPTEAALLEEIVERAPEVPASIVQPSPRPWWRRNLRWLTTTAVLFAGGIGAGVAVGGGFGDDTAPATVVTTVTERSTDVRTTTETIATTESGTVTEVDTTTETTAITETEATTETAVITETETTIVTTTITVTTSPPPPTLR